MADRLGGRRWGWYTGWLNLLGLLGAIAGIDYGAALFTGAFANLQWGFEPTPGKTFVIFCAILLLHAVLNLFGVRLVSLLNSISVWWHLAGVALIVGALAVFPDHHQSPSFVFTEFANETGWSNPLYVAAIGLLLAQYTFSGYDASAHLSEETSHASVAASRGIVRAIWASWLAGFVLLAGLTFAIQDYDATRTTDNRGAARPDPARRPRHRRRERPAARRDRRPAVLRQRRGRGGQPDGVRVQPGRGAARFAPVAQGERPHPDPGRGRLAVRRRGLRARPAVVVLDDGVQRGDRHQRHRHHPGLRDPRVPAAARRRPLPAGALAPGRWSRPVGWIAVGWVACVTVLFCLPQASPVTVSTMNYASVAPRRGPGPRHRLVVRRPPVIRHPHHRGVRQRPRPGGPRGGHRLSGARRAPVPVRTGVPDTAG